MQRAFLALAVSRFGSPRVLHRPKHRLGAEAMFAGETVGDAVAASATEPFIEIENANLFYGGRGGDGVLALTDVNLSIDKGEFIAVVGPSGCGKSSLLKLVSGLHPP